MLYWSVRTYYHGPEAAVTDELFICGSGTYVLAELRDIGRVVHERSRLGRVVTGVLLAVAGAVWAQLTLPGRWYVGVGALIAALVVIGWPSHARSWALRAAYRGNADVTLFVTADVQVFNQVTRALRRALEDVRPR